MSVSAGDPPGGRSSHIDWSVRTKTVDGEEQVKSREEIMKILEAFDLTGSFVGPLAYIAVVALIGAFSYSVILGDIHRLDIVTD